MTQQNVEIPSDKIAEFCEKHHIRKLSLFGSVLRDDFTSESDIDVLVEFEQGESVTYFDLVDIQDGLATMLDRDVDLLTPAALSTYFRTHVLDTAQVTYERK